MDNREELVIKLENFLYSVKMTGKVKSITEDCQLRLKGKMPIGRLKQLLDLSENGLGTLGDNQLYLIADALNYNGLNINLNDFFNKIEQICFDEDYDLNNSIVSFNAIEKDNSCVGFLDYKEIVKMKKSGLLTYDVNTQRVPKIIIDKRGKHVLPSINPKNVQQISKMILTDNFFSNTITFNIVPKSEEECFNIVSCFNNGRIKIDTEKFNITIIDGMHRIMAIENAYAARQSEIITGIKSEQIHGHMVVLLKVLSEKEARKFIIQESLATIQDEKTITLMRISELIREFFKKISPYLPKQINDYSTTERDISTFFLLELLQEFSLIERFNLIINNEENRFNEAFTNCKGFFELLYSLLKEDIAWYEENKNILMSDCFIGGCFLFFFENLLRRSYDISYQENKINDFYIKIKETNPKKMIYNFPITEKSKIKKIYL